MRFTRGRTGTIPPSRREGRAVRPGRATASGQSAATGQRPVSRSNRGRAPRGSPQHQGLTKHEGARSRAPADRAPLEEKARRLGHDLSKLSVKVQTTRRKPQYLGRHLLSDDASREGSRVSVRGHRGTRQGGVSDEIPRPRRRSIGQEAAFRLRMQLALRSGNPRSGSPDSVHPRRRLLLAIAKYRLMR